MQTLNQAKRLETGDCRLLATMLDVETINYKRLLRLAWRQNSYMKRQDVDRLEANAADWSRYLPEADKARVSRERFMTSLGAQLGIPVPPGNMEALLGVASDADRQDLAGRIRRLRKVTTELARQNELNRGLAEFCIDLAREEAEIFKRCVLDDPKACYGENALTTNRGPGGVIVRQA